MEKVILIFQDLHVVDFLITEALYFIIASILIVVASLIDLSTGIRKSRVLKDPIQSRKLRGTLTKLQDYFYMLFFGIVVDVSIHMLSKFYLPVGVAIGCLAVCGIECWSVIENLKARKSLAAKIPDLVQKIIQTKNVKEAAELITTIQEIVKKQSDCKD